MTAADNTPTPECCARLGDTLTNAKFMNLCWRDTLCGGVCKDYDFGNIPGGHGGCKYNPFDPSKAVLLDGGKDCVNSRGLVLDQCRGAQKFGGFSWNSTVVV